MRFLALCTMILMALIAFGCEDPHDYLYTCCDAFASEHDTYQLAFKLGLATVEPLTIEKLSDTSDSIHDPYAMNYLCRIAPMMQNINNSYKSGNDNAYNASCTSAIAKYPDLRNQLDEAYTQCCFVVKPKYDSTMHCPNEADSGKCVEEYYNAELEYVSCYKHYLSTQGECEYQFN